MKKSYLTLAFIAISVMTCAQTVNVHLKNGQNVQYPADNVDYVDFSGKADDPTITSGEAVDLGLSVKWASCNLGATKPEEYGDYYAWGETKPKYKKPEFSKENYSYYDNDKKQYIDIGSNISGTEYDAARVNLGGKWRLPTEKEMKELVEKCSWEWSQINGINGYLIKGKNKKTIFLPAAGNDITNCVQEYLWYCCSELSENEFTSGISASSSFFIYDYGFNRYQGYPIRPVINK